MIRTGAIPVVHVITGLATGGSETMLSRLLEAMPREEFPATVISLISGGPVAVRIRDAGVRVESLGMRRGVPSLLGAWRLRRLVRELRPVIVQGWMYHGNLAAWFARSALGSGSAVAWSVRQTVYDLRRERPGTRVAIRLGAAVSARVDAVIYNSHVARRQHELLGYHPAAARVIPNGFDCGVFRPDPEAPGRLRSELGVPAERLLVGLVSRYHPMKGHGTFFAAARRLLDAGVDAAFVCAGHEVTLDNPNLRAPILRLELGERVHLLGERYDTPRLFAGFDVTCCSSSWGEGFPNVVGESMACGTPCVATDVGDAPAVVGQFGVVVGRDDAAALAGGLLAFLRMPRHEREAVGRSARHRIASEFSLESTAAQYAGLYRRLARADARG